MSIEEKLVEIIGNIIGEDLAEKKIGLETDLINDLSVDSLQMINLLLMIEEEYNVELDYEELDITSFQSVKSIIDLIEKLKQR